MIVAERGGFIPEGVEYDTTSGRILTGSLSEGSIFHIQNDGQVVTVVSDPDLVSSVGIEVDELPKSSAGGELGPVRVPGRDGWAGRS